MYVTCMLDLSLRFSYLCLLYTNKSFKLEKQFFSYICITESVIQKSLFVPEKLRRK
jgi:hypothetical protein